jgi:streptogramin lyase
MAAAPNGDLWFGASHALLRLSPEGEWSRYTRADGLGGDDVLALGVGPDGTVWSAVWEMHAHGYGGCGLSALAPDGTWHRLTAAAGVPSNNVRTLALEADGALWVGTGEEHRHMGEGAARCDTTGRWERYTVTQGLPTNYVEQICVAPDGSTWIITHDLVRRALRLCPDGRRFIYTEQDGLIHPWVNTMAVAPDGAIWFGTAQGASRLGPDQQWTNYGVADGLIHPTVVAVAPAPDGSVWFGTPLGLCRLGADGAWSSYSTGPQRAEQHIHSLCAAPDGSVWAATVSGLFHFQPCTPPVHAPAQRTQSNPTNHRAGEPTPDGGRQQAWPQSDGAGHRNRPHTNRELHGGRALRGREDDAVIKPGLWGGLPPFGQTIGHRGPTADSRRRCPTRSHGRFWQNRNLGRTH